jgi:hypothetical protein
MAEQSVIVWDLETVPDLSATARMPDLGDAPETQVREALGAGFPKHPLHKIACIGALIAQSATGGLARRCAWRAPHWRAARGQADKRLCREDRSTAATTYNVQRTQL